ncbi:MAG: choice-of-anchor B family protein [Bacteroidota bacterium]
MKSPLLIVALALLSAGPIVAQQAAEQAGQRSQPDPVKQIQTDRSALAATQATLTGQRIVCQSSQAAGFPCGGIDLLAFLPISEVGGTANGRVNDIWGWTDPDTEREYVIIGRSDGTGFVDITDPVSPVYLGNLPTQSSPSLWRDVKVLDHYAVIVSEASGHGLQVFDLHQLRDVPEVPARFEPTAHYDGFSSAHNVVVNEATGFAYAVGVSGPGRVDCAPGLHAIDLADPLDPVFAGCFNSGLSRRSYVHDGQCVLYEGPDQRYQGREICFNSEEDAIVIADVTDKDAMQALAAQSYPGASYIHQGWLSEDQRYFFQDDELDELRQGQRTRTFVWDLADLEDPQLATIYEGTGSNIDHNQYVRGRYLYQANYTVGLRVLDIADPENPTEVAFFDTFTGRGTIGPDAPAFEGAWSVYPFFESGVVAISSIREGLFLVLPLFELGRGTDTETEVPSVDRLTAAYPNPFNPQTSFTVELQQAQRVRVSIYNAAGREVERLHDGLLGVGVHAYTFDATGRPSGVYWIRAEGATLQQTRSIVLLR